NWVEKGIAPPASTNYKVMDGQVIVPASAADRKGIQPVVVVKANGSARTDVKPGQAVEFTAVIETPRNAGKIVQAEWDFEGAGDYPRKEQFSPKDKVTVKTTYTFTKPGTYFPALRVASQKQGDSSAQYALVQNLARVRVVVK
ncbi:MAG TPA: hypothetical protein VET48_01005, partial [Steroidobacteraceae bacterium]|nr:hypothetical protein [Steroidobacteraceae bacterium]